MKSTIAVRYIALLLLGFLAAILVAGCAGPPKPVSQTELLLGTTITITVFDRIDSGMLAQAFARVRSIQDRMTTVGTSSEVDEVNQEAGIRPVKVTRDVFDVVKTALEFSRLTNGAFDITVGPIVKLWSIGTSHEQLPTKKAIDELLPLVNWHLVKLDQAAGTIYLEKRGMAIDLGGIAKGYAADEAERILAKAGVRHAILDFGGNIVVMGSKPDGSPWRIGIQTPFADRGSYLGIVTASEMSVVTSGPYERYFVRNGVVYHHIINPKTGYPVEDHLTSTTIYSDVSIVGDGLSTSVFVMGLQDGYALVRDLKGVDAIFVTDSGKVYATPGLAGRFTVTNPDYRVATLDEAAISQAPKVNPRALEEIERADIPAPGQ